MFRQSVRDLTLEQSHGFIKLDEGVQTITNGQDAISKDLRLQTDVMLSNSADLHAKTIANLQRGNEEILNQLHRLQLSSLGIKPEKEEGLNELEKWPFGPSFSTRPREEEAVRRLLDSLNFATMNDRHEQISESHKSTLQWIFEEPKSAIHRWDNFSTWLKTSTPSLYWINGKAGSGKSTLMDFLCGHQITNALLRSWANGTPLVTANFFFWLGGVHHLQRTQKGLLRSILYQILSKKRGLIPIAFPAFLGDEFPPLSWHNSALEKAVRNIFKQDAVPIKAFLLVDGLDEYDGDMQGMAQFFRELSTYQTLKVCVSSRPLPVFHKAFKDARTLMLEYLTFDDIQAYVGDKLGNNELLKDLRLSEGHAKVDALLLDVVTKARGVFLWVEIVVRSLIEGLTNEDQLSDLQSRVDAFPEELEDLYEHMMKKVNPIYRKHSSRLFRIMRTFQTRRHGEADHDKMQARLTVRKLMFASGDVQTALESNIGPLALEEQRAQYRNLELRLKTHCSGLLEIVHKEYLGLWYPGDLPDCPQMKELESSVEYIHRTARDYLEQPHVWAKILVDSREGSKDFDPYLNLLVGIILALKKAPVLHDRQEVINSSLSVIRLVEEAMGYAIFVQQDSRSEMVALIDEVESVMATHWNSWLRGIMRPENVSKGVPDHFSDLVYSGWSEDTDNPLSEHYPGSILTLAVRFGLVEYVGIKFNQGSASAKRDGIPLLDYAARPLSQHITFGADVAPLRMITMLFLEGADPNESFGGRTPWETLLRTVRLIQSNRSGFDQHEFVAFQEMWLKIVELFVRRGAAQSAVCTITGHYVTDKIHENRTYGAASLIKEGFNISEMPGTGNRPWGPIQERARAILDMLEERRDSRKEKPVALGSPHARLDKSLKTALKCCFQ
jgi:hypothetical protein